MPLQPLITHTLSFNTEQIADKIATHGFIIVDNFLNASAIAQLAKEAKHLSIEGKMREATTGKSSVSTENPIENKLRGDSIYWLDTANSSVAVEAYLKATQAIKHTLNQHLFLGLFELESHFAIYPIGSRYHKHLDQFQHDQSRKISCVLYLNETWDTDDGGELRMYLDKSENANFIDIVPLAGRLILFLSDRFPHEVLPAKRERISLTGWFRTRNHSLPV